MKIKATFYLCLAIIFISSINIFSQAPVISKQPHTHGVIQGQKATFSVEATGDTLTYQWYLNDTPIGGATDSTYTTPTTTLLHNGEQFFVLVSNTHGNDTSNVVTLYVTATGSRVTASQIVLYNFNESSGNQIKDVAGLSNPLNLTIHNMSSVDQSNHGLFVSGGAQIYSTDINASARVNDDILGGNEMTVEMWMRPLTTQTTRIIDYGKSLAENNFNIESLSPYGYSFVTTTDSLNNPYGYSWGIADTMGLTEDLIHLTIIHSSLEGIQKIYENGVEIASDSTKGNLDWTYLARLTLGSYFDGTVPWEGIFYKAAIYNRALDSVEVAHNFSVGVNGPGIPFIIGEPETNQVLVGFPGIFSVNVVSDSSLSYQWQKNGTDIPGATDSVYTTPATVLADSGNVYRVIVTNYFGSDTSDNAVLIVKSVSTDCPNGITHYYHLDETSSPYKDIVGFSDGTSSTPPSSIAGVVGNAQNFSNQTIDIPDDNSFDWKFDDSFSIEFWMKTSNTPVGNVVMVGRADAVSTLIWWVGVNSNGHIYFTLTDVNNVSASIGDKDPVVNDDKWHLITAIRDNAVGKNYLYIDGNKVDSIAANYTGGFASTAQINVGYLNSSFYYNGSLDEVAFYSVNLPQADIQDHYYKGLKGYGYCEMIPPITTPTNLIAIKDNVDSTNVNLAWQDNSSNELGFVIQRKLGDTTSVELFAAMDTVGADVATYTDTTVSDTTTYTYRVYAYNADTVSQFSNLAQITTAVPVELTSFTANVVNGKVTLSWETATEINNAGFRIERSNDNKVFSEIAFIKGNGTSTEKISYSYTDKSALSGKYYYRLKQVDFDGSYNYSRSIEADMGLPTSYALYQNYPNPFNPSTIIRFALPMNARVNINLYNTLGQEVTNILNSDFDAGVHETTFNASNISSGVYFYRLEVHGIDGSNFTSTKRMLLMK